jgi:DNA-directed RNA polymerase subunit RPC12/RpoP
VTQPGESVVFYVVDILSACCGALVYRDPEAEEDAEQPYRCEMCNERVVVKRKVGGYVVVDR